MAFSLPDLPYEQDALDPVISGNTMSFHHGKHHQAYVNKTNELIKDSDLEGKSLEEVIKAAKDQGNTTLFNQSAQIWNHTFFWDCMTPGGGGRPTGEIADKIDEDFGSYEKFAESFKASATGNFGSGWTWLVQESGKLSIANTSNADTPLVSSGQKPLLTIDVWEHAYYLDYQNRRPDFVQAFLDSLVNWDYVKANMLA